MDVIAGGILPNRTVTIRRGSIVDVGSSGPRPAAVHVLDGRGKFLIPGLWDMHAHTQGAGVSALDLHVANGVTGVRDMGSDADFILPLRQRVRRGEIVGPDIVAAGPILDAAPADWPFRRRVTSAREAREAVRHLHSRGVDFIKVHTHTPREAFFAIAEDAPRLGLPFAGHAPVAVTIAEAAEAGIKSIEHLSEFRVFVECSGQGQPYDAARCRPFFERLAALGVWQTPTLDFFRVLPALFSGKPLPHAEYASESLRELTRGNVAASKMDDGMVAALRAMSRASFAVVDDLHATGTPLLAGCDATVPGFCLHDELRALTEAGLSPLQALQTATINPARFLGRQATHGTVAAGRRADLVLLEANPLEDIRHTTTIAAVVVGGHALSRSDLERRLAVHRREERARGGGSPSTLQRPVIVRR